MTRLRCITKTLSMALITLLLSVFLFTPTANALSIQGPSFLGGTFDRQGEVDAIHRLVVEKSKAVDTEVKEAKEIASKKLSLAEEVQQLKDQVSSLDDMFVHINRYAGNAAGNSYAPLNCTWYVKSKRPDINNFWGNANTWYQNAKAQGWNVGTEAKKGAVATTTAGPYGHVAYVDGVSLDGETVWISEMNYGRLGAMNYRSVHYTEFTYIYELD